MPDSPDQTTIHTPLISTHTHTDLSRCGRDDMTFAAIVDQAEALGYAVIILTDHVHVPWYTDYPAHLERLAQYRTWRNGLRTPLQLFVGAEFEVRRPGHVLAPPEFVAASEVTVVAPNHYQLDWVEPLPRDPGAAAAHELDCIETIINWAPADVIVHPFTGGGAEMPANVLYAAADTGRLRELCDRAIQADVAFEIQPKFWRNPLADRLCGFFEQWLDAGGKVALGSDAHHLAALSRWAAELPDIVARFELTAADIWWPGAAASQQQSERA